MKHIHKIQSHFERNRKNYQFLFVCLIIVILFTHSSQSDYNFMTESYNDSEAYAAEAGPNLLATLFMTFGLYLFGKFAAIYLREDIKK